MIYNIEKELREKILFEEFDYLALKNCLNKYSHPRDKISDLIKKKIIIRVKKGIYIFSKEYSRRLYSMELLANLIYGPSYVSLESALSYYQIIPEDVKAITSIVLGRSKKFVTPLGLFLYRSGKKEAYPINIRKIEINQNCSFLIASPEKALADKLVEDRGNGIRTQKDLYSYLIDNLRIDEKDLISMNLKDFEIIADKYKSKKIDILCKLIFKLRKLKKG